MEEEFKGIYAGGDYSAADAELGFFRLSEIEKLPDMVRYLLDDPGRMQQLADAGYKKSSCRSHLGRQWSLTEICFGLCNEPKE